MHADGMMKYPGLCMVVLQIKLHGAGDPGYIRTYMLGVTHLNYCSAKRKQNK